MKFRPSNVTIRGSLERATQIAVHFLVENNAKIRQLNIVLEEVVDGVEEALQMEVEDILVLRLPASQPLHQ